MDIGQWNHGLLNIDDDLQEAEKHYISGRDAVIFLIDFTEPMFREPDDKTSHIHLSLECYKTTLLNTIIGSDRDLIGIVLFGTKKKNNLLNVDGLTVLQELSQPSAEKVKQIQDILEGNSIDKFEEEYGHSDDYTISNALWLCQDLFGKSTFKLSSKQIFLFTCTSSPHENSVHKQHQARTKAMDLCQVGIDLELMQMGEEFNADLFYKEIVQLSNGKDSADWQLPDPTSKFDELLLRINRKNHKKRSLLKMFFTLGKGVRCGIGIYNLVGRKSYPSKINLDRSTNEIVSSSSVTFDSFTGKEINAIDLKKYQNFGGRKIVFDNDEVKGLRKMIENGLKLIGFKPAERLKTYHHMKSSSFIYPEENLVKGSCTLFTALLMRCLARNLIAICCLTTRTSSTPKIVALVPQEEVLNKSKSQIVPPGFHIIYLPFADNIRKLDLPSPPEVTPEEEEKAKQVIAKLKFNYNPSNFENPRLQTHWNNIEALALNYEEARPVHDYTKPDHKIMSEKLGSLSSEFNDLFFENGVISEPKKKRAGEGTSRQAKVQKADVNENEIQNLAQQGKVDSLKVDQLKSFLSSQGIPTSGKKKADLVSLVYEHFEIDQTESEPQHQKPKRIRNPK